MRRLIAAALALIALTACATSGHGNATSDATSDASTVLVVRNDVHHSVNLLFFDARHGNVRERVHNLPGGRSTRSLDYRRIAHRELGVAVDRSGVPVPHPAGGAAPRTVRVTSPNDVVCVTAGSKPYQDDIYLDACVD